MEQYYGWKVAKMEIDGFRWRKWKVNYAKLQILKLLKIQKYFLIKSDFKSLIWNSKKLFKI